MVSPVSIPETTNGPFKKVTQAHSSSYPSIELSEGIALVTKISTDLGNTQYHDKELIAKALGFAWSSLKMKISTCVQYGLVELKHGIGYKVTLLFIQIY